LRISIRFRRVILTEGTPIRCSTPETTSFWAYYLDVRVTRVTLFNCESRVTIDLHPTMPLTLFSQTMLVCVCVSASLLLPAARARPRVSANNNLLQILPNPPGANFVALDSFILPHNGDQGLWYSLSAENEASGWAKWKSFGLPKAFNQGCACVYVV
jgi:hypothetical protein